MDEEQFEQLFREYGPLVWSVIRKAGIRDPDAEDLFYEIWHAVAVSFPSFEGRACLSTWIGSIASHKCLDYIRRHGREIPWDPHLFRPEWRGQWQRPSRRTPSPRRNAIRKEELALLAEAIDRLPPVRKRIFELYLAGFKYKTIADTLNASSTDPIDAAFVGKQIYLAKLAIRDILRGSSPASA